MRGSTRLEIGPRSSGAIRVGLFLGGIAALVILWLSFGPNGYDSFSYWRVPHFEGGLYSGAQDPGGLGVYRYSPAFAQAISPLWPLPWEAFRAVSFAASAAALVWASRRNSLWLLGLPPVWLELWIGNIHLLMAAALVASFRWPVAWAFILLTKVTPGVGLLWFVARREWRSFGLALIATGAVIAVSILVDGHQVWLEWIAALQTARTLDGFFDLPLPPLPVRLVLAAALVFWAARVDRPWIVPVAATIALPTIWGHGLAMLVAMVPLASSASRTAVPPDRVA